MNFVFFFKTNKKYIDAMIYYCIFSSLFNLILLKKININLIVLLRVNMSPVNCLFDVSPF